MATRLARTTTRVSRALRLPPTVTARNWAMSLTPPCGQQPRRANTHKLVQYECCRVRQGPHGNHGGPPQAPPPQPPIRVVKLPHWISGGSSRQPQCLTTPSSTQAVRLKTAIMSSNAVIYNCKQRPSSTTTWPSSTTANNLPNRRRTRRLGVRLSARTGGDALPRQAQCRLNAGQQDQCRQAKPSRKCSASRANAPAGDDQAPSRWP